MFKNILILSLILTIRSSILKTKTQIKHVEDYYNCLRDQHFKIANQLHKHTIVCNLNENCILKSNSCPNHFDKLKFNWLKSNKELNLNTAKYDLIGSSLVINSVENIDEGFYQEVLNNKTLISEYHVTIQFKSIHYPVYENDFVLENTNDVVDILVEWSKWSDCRCNELNKNKYRIRFGECYVSPKHNAYRNYTIFNYFKNPIRCQSKLATELNIVKHDFIMYGDCESTCTCRLNSTLKFSKNFLNLPKVQIIKANFGDNIQLDCDLNLTIENFHLLASLDLIWKRNHDLNSYKFDLKQNLNKLFVDKKHRLIINSVNYFDSGNYTCFYENQVKKKVHLQVNDDSLKDRLFNYASQIGCAFVILTLILVNLFAFLQRNSLKQKLQ